MWCVDDCQRQFVGTVAIWDFKMSSPGSPPDRIADCLSLLFRIGSRARCHTADEYVGWLEAAGSRDVTMHSTPAPAQVLVTGRAP
jgi:hypothetical protein